MSVVASHVEDPFQDAIRAPRPGIAKAELFERRFSHALESVEHCAHLSIRRPGRLWYNPDFWCEELGAYIECCTSRSNFTEQGLSWRSAIKRGHPLRIYWWTGPEITALVIEKAPSRSILELEPVA